MISKKAFCKYCKDYEKAIKCRDELIENNLFTKHNSFNFLLMRFWNFLAYAMSIPQNKIFDFKKALNDTENFEEFYDEWIKESRPEELKNTDIIRFMSCAGLVTETDKTLCKMTDLWGTYNLHNSMISFHNNMANFFIDILDVPEKKQEYFYQAFWDMVNYQHTTYNPDDTELVGWVEFYLYFTKELI